MPVQLEMAKPADLAGEYLKGVQTAGQIRAEQQRLDAEAQQTAMKLQAASQESNARLQQQAKQLQEEHAIQQQRIAVSQSYNQQKAALRKQQLDQVAQVNAQKTASAARQFEARQRWEKEFSRIDADTSMTPDQKQAEKTRFTMRLAPLMGIPGTEAAAMLREMRPEKPTIPASVTDAGDFMQVTQPNGTVQLHPKPRAANPKADNVKVRLSADQVPTTMSRAQAEQTIRNLPEELQSDPVNRAAMPPPTPMSFDRPPEWMKPMVAAARGGQQFKTPDEVKAAYQAGKLTREQAKKVLVEQFGHAQ